MSSIDDASVQAVAELVGRGPTMLVPIPGTGRVLAADVEGPPDGTPVVLIHGTPDSRLARHPDSSMLERLDIHLIAVDRPGFGYSTYDPATTPTSFGQDLTALLDNLNVTQTHVVAWSAGALWALGAVDTLGERISSVTICGGLVPFDAFDDPEVRAAAGDTRLAMIDAADELGADIAAEMIAPLLVPDPMSPAAALEHRLESGPHDLDAIPGATIQMAAACCDAVRQGHEGLVRDFTVHFTPRMVDLGAIGAPVRLVTGANDDTCPPAFAHWYARQLPDSHVEIIDDAGHGVMLTHWEHILGSIAHNP